MTDGALDPDQTQLMHATSVARNGIAALIIGPSGAGKSALALQLMALGAELIADDQTELFVTSGMLWARKPAALPAMIEAHGVGLLHANMGMPAPVGLIVDMGVVSQARCPEDQGSRILGHTIPKWDKVNASHFPAAILLYLTQMSVTR